MLKNIIDNGIQGGFPGFTYYDDTVKFFDDNRDLILDALQDDANDFGEELFSMIANFNCLKSYDFSTVDIAEAIYYNSDNSVVIKNALAWYAAEKAVHSMESDINEKIDDIEQGE